MAPLYLYLRESKDFETKCIITAQHRDMLDSILNTFQITPDYDLNIMSDNQTITGITTKILTDLEPVLVQENPDLVLVHGDTTTAFSAALICFYHKIKVGHVEAGMRSFDIMAPYPEEMNRKLIADLAQLHFAATPASRENLLREGVEQDSVSITGNTVIDALKMASQMPYEHIDAPLKSIDYEHSRVILMTCHRREILGESMEGIFEAIKTVLQNYPDVVVVFPIHKNPKVREAFQKVGITDSRMVLVEPLDYLSFIHVMKNSYLIVTDSGGIQEEAPFFGVPVVVVRDVTERKEAIDAGTVLLAGTNRENVYHTIAKLLDDGDAYHTMHHAVNPYGDGQACSRILENIRYAFGLRNTRPEEFSGDRKVSE